MVRYSHHAKNRMRREGVRASLVEAVVIAPERRRIDREGHSVAVGRDDHGRILEVVLASDVPGYVITVIIRRKWR
jgi:Domain of unknown function (DUF4258)